MLKSSEIGGEILGCDQVRSSIARRLGMDIGGLVPADRDLDGVVEMMLDATQKYADGPNRRAAVWLACGGLPERAQRYAQDHGRRMHDDKAGPMQVISSPVRRKRVHYEAPKAGRVPQDMKAFLAWFNAQEDIDPVLKAGVAHL